MFNFHEVLTFSQSKSPIMRIGRPFPHNFWRTLRALTKHKHQTNDIIPVNQSQSYQPSVNTTNKFCFITSLNKTCLDWKQNKSTENCVPILWQNYVNAEDPKNCQPCTCRQCTLHFLTGSSGTWHMSNGLSLCSWVISIETRVVRILHQKKTKNSAHHFCEFCANSAHFF